MRIVVFILLISSMVFGQESQLKIPRNIKKAYTNGTRDYSGVPGKNYWINKAKYIINAELFPNENKLVGSEKILYENNSPDSLKKIVIRLYNDFYKSGSIRDWQISPKAVNNGVQINSIKINDKKLNKADKNQNVSRFGTNMAIYLDKVLAPGETIKLGLDWSTIIPSINALRMGAFKDSSFFIAYWYPQIAAYDDIDGWDQFNYSGTTEFYNDFSDFQVDLTVPKNYLVWATGQLANPEEVLSENVLEKYQKALKSNEVVNIVLPEDLGNQTLPYDKLIWKYRAVNVPDFSFGTSDKHLWDGVNLSLTNLRRNVFVGAAYRVTSKDFKDVASIAKKALEYFSYELPGVPYPYPEMTVFNGSNGGGMETPMMVNDGSVKSWARVVGLTSHEIAHTYFPFYMGINEKKYSWMEEGFAVMLPMEFQYREAEKTSRLKDGAKTFERFAGLESEIPLVGIASYLTGGVYRNYAYHRPGFAYRYLQDYLGKAKFKNALNFYMDNWNGKHPLPYDFFLSFNTSTGENLDWYWKSWFFETNYPDLEIVSAIQEDNNLKVIVANKGQLPMPILLSVKLSNGEKKEFYYNCGLWKVGFENKTINLKVDDRVESIEIGNQNIPDVNREDNKYNF